MRLFALIIAALLLPSFASADLDLAKYGSWQIFDSDCTDSFSLPAPPVATDLTITNNWDTVAEAIDPSLNKDAPAQTSGSADGWCDATPWIIKLSHTHGADEDVFVGPFKMPAEGFYWQFDPGTLTVTTFSVDWGFIRPWAPTTFTNIWLEADSSSTTGILRLIAPYNEGSSQVTAGDYGPQPATPLYLKVDINGAGDFTMDAWVIAVKKGSN